MKLNKNLIVVIAVVLVCTIAPVLAQRIYTADFQVGVVGATDDNPRVSGLGISSETTNGFVLNYGLFPSISLNSQGAQSNFDLTYAFGFNRVDSDLDLNSDSHRFGGSFSGNLTPRLRVNLSENFARSPDFNTFDLFRGVVFSPEGVFFDIEQVAIRRNRYHNTARLNMDYELSSRSSLVIGLAHTLLQYDFDPDFSLVRDQNGTSGQIGYSRGMGPNTFLNLTYFFSYFDFSGFHDARSQAFGLGLRHDLSRTVSISFSGGPSKSQSIGTEDGFIGYDASFAIAKSFEDQTASFFYRRSNGASTGVGSFSTAQNIGVNFVQPISRNSTLNLGLSLYESQQQFDNPFSSRGLVGSVTVSFALTENLLLSLGGSYTSQKADEFSRFTLDRRRAFLSFQFVLPEFWRVTR